MKPLLTTKETARLLSISPRKLWEITRRGDLASIRLGRSVRYAPEDIERYVYKHRKSRSR